MPTIILVRHGNTGPGDNDLDRQLTQVGVRQAVARAVQLRTLGFDHVHVSAVFHSPALRAKETAETIFTVKHQHSFMVDEWLYAAATHPEMGEAHKALGGSAPPSIWIEKYPKLWLECCHHAAKTHAKITQVYRSAKIVAIVGHGTLLNAVATKFVSNEDSKKKILEFAFPECGAIVIRDENDVSFLE